jgi:pimeloyl-ACP methyl ester carboxylesterase
MHALLLPYISLPLPSPLSYRSLVTYIMSSPLLFFKSLNTSASSTLLLLHGALSSHHEWDLITPNLPSYHLLIPDLPSHGQSSSTTLPFNIPDTAVLLANLISKEAKGGKAGIVGMSLGGYIAVYTVHKYPALVKNGMFLSGCGKVWAAPGSWTTWANGFTIFLAMWISTHMPRSWFRWVCDKSGMSISEELYADMKARASLRLGHAVMGALAEIRTPDEDGWRRLCEGVKARTCIVAAALDDGVKECGERGKELRTGNEESRAFKVEWRRHAWDLQDPKLFAEGIRAWLGSEPMPDGYDELD